MKFPFTFLLLQLTEDCLRDNMMTVKNKRKVLIMTNRKWKKEI
jgi:hypothetical protein